MDMVLKYPIMIILPLIWLYVMILAFFIGNRVTINRGFGMAVELSIHNIHDALFSE